MRQVARGTPWPTPCARTTGALRSHGGASGCGGASRTWRYPGRGTSFPCGAVSSYPEFPSVYAASYPPLLGVACGTSTCMSCLARNMYVCVGSTRARVCVCECEFVQSSRRPPLLH